jgi:XTP/dITP diphosphohydrolase
MKDLVFATNNQNKLREIRELLADSSFNILSLDDLGFAEEIEEPYDTLEENAMHKAKHIHFKYGINVFADDTGLEVDELNGEPGVYSARYAGVPPDSLKNMEKVLSKLKNKESRTARFRTVIALILNDEELYFNGIIEGRIANEKSGELGFGYDPIFIPEKHNITFAEMSAEDKNKISHRGRAVRNLVDYLNSNRF